jgi:peptidoglycan/LPS O-acetylase OafA/YrhL
LREFPDHRANSFDLVRLLAALAVLVSHMAQPYFGRQADIAGEWLRPENLGGVGVNVFFAISGYLICGSLLRRDGRAGYARRRAARILPGLFGCIAFCVFAGAFFTEQPLLEYLSSWQLVKFLLNALIFPLTFVPTTALCNPAFGCGFVGPFWSLAYEVVAYALLALVFASAPKARTALTILIAGIVVLALAAQIESHLVGAHQVVLPLGDLDLIRMDSQTFSLLGGVFFFGALLRIAGESVLKLHWALLACAALMLARWADAMTFAIIAIPAIPIATITAARIPSRASRWLTERCGDLSYGVYLYHYPVLVMVWLTSWPAIGPWPAAAAAVALTFALASCSYRLIERPAMLRARAASAPRDASRHQMARPVRASAAGKATEPS